MPTRIPREPFLEYIFKKDSEFRKHWLKEKSGTSIINKLNQRLGEENWISFWAELAARTSDEAEDIDVVLKSLYTSSKIDTTMMRMFIL